VDGINDLDPAEQFDIVFKLLDAPDMPHQLCIRASYLLLGKT
jgi:hypothetical protein